MGRRAVMWLAGLGLADILIFFLTLHAHSTYHHGATGPRVMPLGQLLGFMIAGALLVLIAILAFGARQSEKYRQMAAGSSPRR
jgi:hypothetical protein